MGLADEVEHTGKIKNCCLQTVYFILRIHSTPQHNKLSIAPKNIVLLRVIVKLGSTCEAAHMNHYCQDRMWEASCRYFPCTINYCPGQLRQLEN
jgi:hypothetical protein